MATDGTMRTGQPKSTLSPLPGPPAKLRRGYLWANLMVGVVYVVAMVLVATEFLAVPYADPVRSGAWYIVIGLMIITPAAVTVAALSCVVVYVLRRTIARSWPGPLQALPAVVLVLGLITLLVRVLFADDPSTPNI